jgi:hypothetical protein
MQTYSVDFFITAFFTGMAHRGVLVGGGGVTPADGAVPACNIQVVRQLDTKFGCIICKQVIVYTSCTKQ